MNKRYLQPIIETYPITALSVLCVSGEVNDNLGGGGQGKNPWDYGRAPRRTPAF